MRIGNIGLTAAKKSRPQLNAACAKHESGGNTPTVRDTTCGNNGNAYCIDNLRQKREKARSGTVIGICKRTWMAARLVSLRNYAINATGFQNLCLRNRRRTAQNEDSRILNCLNDFLIR